MRASPFAAARGRRSARKVPSSSASPRRASPPRPRSPPSSSSERPARGFVRVRMPPDGNCLFHALAHPHDDHREVRARVVRELRARWAAEYAAFVPEHRRAGYCAEMARAGAWGGELEIAAYARAARARVAVHAAHAPHAVLAAHGPPGARATRRLLYDGAHYDLAVPA